MRRYWRGVLVGLSAYLLVGSLNVPAEAEDETTVKLGYYYNFTKFVEWPTALEEPVMLCVLGDGVVKPAAAIMEGKQLKQHPIVVADAKRVAGFKGCQAIFIGATESWRIDALIRELKDRPILTVSDVDKFAERGGMIGLVRDEGKVRFEINLDAVQKAGLKLGSQVAKLAVRTIGGMP